MKRFLSGSLKKRELLLSPLFFRLSDGGERKDTWLKETETFARYVTGLNMKKKEIRNGRL